MTPPQEVRAVKEVTQAADGQTTDALMDLILELRQQARAQRDFTTADVIRDRLQELNIVVTDGPDGDLGARLSMAGLTFLRIHD